jgi:hypothetical protein
MPSKPMRTDTTDCLQEESPASAKALGEGKEMTKHKPPETYEALIRVIHERSPRPNSAAKRATPNARRLRLSL